MNRHRTQIIPFPSGARLSNVLDAALTIASLDAGDALTWWKRRARLLADELREQGVEDHRITAEVVGFQNAVFTELARIPPR